MNYLKLICLALLFMIKAPMMNATPNDVLKDMDVQGVQQSITITGVIVDSDNQPLPGVNVRVKGTTLGTTTDINGKYTLAVPSSTSVLHFSYIGYSSKEITVGNQRSIDVTMEEDTMTIDEVVVVAYGTVKKKDLTGSVSSIENKVIAQQQLTSVSRALEGTVAGVRTSIVTGQPGADAKIVIRGFGSIDGNVGTEALIVVDGVPLYNTSLFGSNQAVTNFSSIAPNDIESITISKDAASNALYGSRGANGVVFITTKKGTTGKARVSVESRVGITQLGVPSMDWVKEPQQFFELAWQMVYNRYRYMSRENADGSVYMYANTEKPSLKNPQMSQQRAAELASRNLFQNAGATAIDATSINGIGNYTPYRWPQGEYLVNTDGKLNPHAQLLYTDDWSDYFIESRFRQEHNLNIQGGNDQHKYYVSLGYLNDPSYIARSQFERYSTRASLNSQVNKWLQTSFNVNYSHRVTEFVGTNDNPGTTNRNIFFFKDAFCPMWTLHAYDKDGNIKKDPNTGETMWDFGTGQTQTQMGNGVRNNFSGYSPAVYFLKDRRSREVDELGLRGEATVTFLRDFRATVNLSMNNQYLRNLDYNNNESGSEAVATQGGMNQAHSRYVGITTQQLLTWNRSFDVHNFDVMLGHEFWWLGYDQTNASWRTMLIPEFISQGNTVTINSTPTADQSRAATEGYFSRLNYNYDGRYLISASLRRDGTSKFVKNKWGTFWSFGGAWRISQESFMKNISPINDLKVRASYGTMGNAQINNISPTMTTWSLTNTGSVTAPVMGINQGSPANRDLTWETNKQFDLGMDFRIFKRFYGTVDYFNRVTEDMIWGRPLPASTGVGSRLENIGSLRNYGLEIEFGVNIINTADIRWNIDANITFLKTELLSIPEGVGSPDYGGNFVQDNYLRGVGKCFYNLYYQKFAGIDPETGLALLYRELSKADVETEGSPYKGKTVGELVKVLNISGSAYETPTRFEQGTTLPKATGGFGTSFTYKNWDLNVLCSYQIGGKYYSAVYNWMGGMNLGRSMHVDVLDAWSPENTSSKIPMRFNGMTNSAQAVMALFDASYFNLKSVTLGYNLPKRLMNKWGMSGIRVYAAIDNAFLKSVKKGLDPRYSLGLSTDGFAAGTGTYSQPRNLSLGCNVSF